MNPTHRCMVSALAFAALVSLSPRPAHAAAHRHKQTAAQSITVNTEVAAQPLLAQSVRIREALDLLGAPLSPRTKAALTLAATARDRDAVLAVQKALDPYCLLAAEINPESRVKVLAGPARPILVEQGWRVFLIKVFNQAGVTAELKAVSANARPLAGSPKAEVRDRWLDMALFNNQPLQRGLSGLPVEYRILLLSSRDAGKREAKISLNVGQGTQDLGFRNEADILFTCLPAAPVTFKVQDENGKPATAMFLIRDALGRVYPSQTKRLAPDLAFHPQIYRADGETLRLPSGDYTVEYTRGPEYLARSRALHLTGKPAQVAVKLERWIDPSKLGWWSGDHHIHAAGCAHYDNPTEGVLASDMIRQCLGEDVKVGCNLTWGPCFDFQKQFFTGKVDKVSQFPYLLRYDIEVSGFGSHNSGHLCLLRLKDQMYPGGTSDTHWPTLGLNTLRWAKAQGAVCGPAHSGWGLEVDTSDLPNYVVPKYSGIGANEYVVDVTHLVPGPDGAMVPAVDFMSTVDTPMVWELNMWYHTLNCGYRTRISGETDFPCIYGERVGLGRSYVKLDGKLTFEDWCEGIRNGRCYVSDGRSHLMDLKANGLGVGEKGSELALPKAGTVHLTAKVAALLSEAGDEAIRKRPYTQQPYWNIERSRIEGTRQVPVEVIVNGYPVARKVITADGTARQVEFDVKVDHSSWVALRILGSSHSNPFFVVVDGKPIRASRRSAEWCLKGVDQCWSQKRQFIKPAEMQDAQSAYDHAREAYRRILAESVGE
jgi:hypothetical protein